VAEQPLKPEDKRVLTEAAPDASEDARDLPAQRRKYPDSEVWSLLGSLGGLFTVVAALFGAITFVGLSFATAAVYSPVGVEPSEVGLDYANLLAESAQIVAYVLSVPILGALVVLGGFLLVRVLGRFEPFQSPRLDEEARKRSVRRARLRRRIVLIVVAVLVSLYAAAWAYFNVVLEVQAARGYLLRGWGETGTSVTTPWEFEVVHVRWLDDSKSLPALPNCMLYLGRDSGTDVFYAPRKERTLRLPASAIYIGARKDHPGC
jgi:hypothetical protein